MYLRISFDLPNYDEINTVEVDISHFSCWFDDQTLCLYDHDSSIFEIPLKFIYTFSHVDSQDAGIDFIVYRNLNLLFNSLGFKEVDHEPA